MKKRHLLLGGFAVVSMVVAGSAYVISPTIHPGQTGEAPELGRQGSHEIGTAELSFALPDRSRITALSLVTGNTEPSERVVATRIWYPAESGTGTDPEPFVHVMNMPGKDPFEIASRSLARPNAVPKSGERYPLVLISHGYGGWNTQTSNLAEHLASRGYVAAAIDHGDALGDGPASFLLSFGNVLADRTLDQRQVLAQIISAAVESRDGYATIIDVEKVGLIGYSMGGYGALATAGADYSYDEAPLSNLPSGAIERLRQPKEPGIDIDALVAIAPWGGQPDSRAWTEATLAKLTVPTLVIAGDKDDVVDFDQGVTWLFDNMVNSNRYLLVYREARHNVVGNHFDVGPDTPFDAVEFMREPVWRTDRINTINQHFVTAFFDWKLKGRDGMAAYLNVSTEDSNAGEWPTGFNERLNGSLAGAEQDKYWRGFQRRWAAGMTLHAARAGERTGLSKGN